MNTKNSLKSALKELVLLKQTFVRSEKAISKIKTYKIRPNESSSLSTYVWSFDHIDDLKSCISQAISLSENKDAQRVSKDNFNHKRFFTHVRSLSIVNAIYGTDNLRDKISSALANEKKLLDLINTYYESSSPKTNKPQLCKTLNYNHRRCIEVLTFVDKFYTDNNRLPNRDEVPVTIRDRMKIKRNNDLGKSIWYSTILDDYGIN